jgi:hypothetical protein
LLLRHQGHHATADLRRGTASRAAGFACYS